MLDMSTAAFWIAVLQIILIDILLGGDNAVVIALACRKLPDAQRKKGIFWGVVGAIGLRIVMIFFALQLLAIPWLKIVGALLLFWIGIKLLVPEDDEADINASEHLLTAIKTILIADLVMSLDNVIAVAAAAGGSMTLLILGLAISIPLVVFGATLLVTLMDRFPVIITIGAALIGMVAGEMLVTDPVALDWMKGMAGIQIAGGKPMLNGVNLELLAGAVGAVIVVVWGLLLAKRQEVGAKSASDEKIQPGNS